MTTIVELKLARPSERLQVVTRGLRRTRIYRHQLSTKTFELFDEVCLLSQGKACFYGPTVNLLSFLQSIDLPVPTMANPAEHILNITNADFST